MVSINNIWQTIDDHQGQPNPRNFMRVAQESDLMLALNYYRPGYKNEFHHHFGTSQSFLVMKGELTLRTMNGTDQPAKEDTLGEGDCALIATGEDYQLENATDEPLVLYQAKQPTDRIQILGHEPVNAKAHFGETV